MDMIVTAPFGDYAKGDRITDAVAVEALWDSPHVVRVASAAPIVPDVPTPPADPAS